MDIVPLTAGCFHSALCVQSATSQWECRNEIAADCDMVIGQHGYKSPKNIRTRRLDDVSSDATRSVSSVIYWLLSVKDATRGCLTVRHHIQCYHWSSLQLVTESHHSQIIRPSSTRTLPLRRHLLVINLLQRNHYRISHSIDHLTNNFIQLLNIITTIHP